MPPRASQRLAIEYRPRPVIRDEVEGDGEGVRRVRMRITYELHGHDETRLAKTRPTNTNAQRLLTCAAGATLCLSVWFEQLLPGLRRDARTAVLHSYEDRPLATCHVFLEGRVSFPLELFLGSHQYLKWWIAESVPKTAH